MKDQKNRNAEIADRIIKKFDILAADRTNWDSHWREIAERFIPTQKDMFQNAGPYQQNQGDKRTQKVFDSTAPIALNRFAAILDSLLTPANQTWHRLAASDPELNKIREVRLYFDEVNKRLFRNRYAPQANFSAQNQQQYKSLGAYGTGCMFIDDLKQERGLRYRNCHLGEIYIDENHQGIVDTVIRKFSMKGRQALQKWGLRVGPKLEKAAKAEPDRDFFFLHSVEPRGDEFNPFRRDFMGMPVASFYVCLEDRYLIEEGGYNVFPYATPRYEQTPPEKYGRSPGMDVLPAVKTLNEQKKTLLKQGHRAVDPVLLTADDGIIGTMSLKPGAINAGGVSPDGKPLVHTLPVGQPMIAKELMDDERAVINDSFLISIFQILIETPQMSATEVLERAKEKGILLAPTIGRQRSEYLGPLIIRELDVLDMQGLLPQMPQVLREARGEYQIQYDSPLSRQQRAEEASGFMRTLEMALQAVNVTQDPTPLFYFNLDAALPEIADIQGVPTRWMNDEKKVKMMKAAKMQQEQTAQMIEAAPGTAAVMNAVGKIRK